MTKFKVGDKVYSTEFGDGDVVPFNVYTVKEVRSYIHEWLLFEGIEYIMYEANYFKKYDELSPDEERVMYKVEDDEVDCSVWEAFPEATKKASETQIGGTHYTEMGLQPFEATYLNFGYMGLKAAVYTKVLKYFRSKNNELEDLKKARHCIDILIEKAEQEKCL